MKAKPEEFTIIRRRWLRGKMSKLRDASGKQCCLGFYARAYGYKAKEIEGVEDLHHLLGVSMCEAQKVQPLGITYSNHYDLMQWNDDGSVDDQERESRIAEIFDRHGVAVKFV